MQSSKNMKPYPSFLDLISELSAVGEFSRFASAAWTSRLVAPTQHPKALLLIPGFLAGDVTLYPFGDWLRSCGHRVFFPGMLANTGCPRLAVDRLLHLVREHHNRKGEKMVVIGHSLGGIYAREEGLPEDIWKAIYFQYLPLGVEADAPPTKAQLGKAAATWAAVSLADKLKSIFAGT